MCSFVGSKLSFLKLGSVLAGFRVVVMSNFSSNSTRQITSVVLVQQFAF